MCMLIFSYPSFCWRWRVVGSRCHPGPRWLRDRVSVRCVVPAPCEAGPEARLKLWGFLEPPAEREKTLHQQNNHTQSYIEDFIYDSFFMNKGKPNIKCPAQKSQLTRTFFTEAISKASCHFSENKQRKSISHRNKKKRLDYQLPT